MSSAGDDDHKLHAPAAERNRQPILEVLERILSPLAGAGVRPLVVEVASGSGQHAAWFAPRLPHVEWQPTDRDEVSLASIAAWAAEVGAANLRTPLRLDAAASDWPVERADAVVCINMVHIAPWAAAVGLFRGAARLLGDADGRPLVLYGPFRFDGIFTAPSNQAFDAALRERDSSWGLRDVEELEVEAGASGFVLDDVVAMPANNHTLVFRRTRPRE